MSNEIRENTIKNILLPGLSGNILEWYDFAVYAYLAPLISANFFPQHNKTISLIETFGIFAAGFLMRPIGAIIFGHYGDRMGRKAVLIITIALLSIATVLIGCLPGYSTLGIFSAILLTFCRLAQGLAIGGEPGYCVYLVEHVPNNKRGFYGSLPICCSIIGFLLGSAVAALFGSLLSTDTFSAWGWRIPFFLGIPLGLIGLYFRLHMPETPIFSEMKALDRILHSPLSHALKTEFFTIIKGIALAFIPFVTSFVLVVYLPSYLNIYLKTPIHIALMINTISMIPMALTVPIAGLISDRIGRKPIFFISGLLFIILSYPLFLIMLKGTYLTITIIQTLFAILVGICYAPIYTILIEMFPTNIRYTSLSLSYNLAGALFGGTVPMVCTFLIATTHNLMMPSFLLIFAGIITLLVLPFVAETYKKTLLL